MNDSLGRQREWLEPDGLGGFASGTVGLIRTRRYHGLLLAATTPPTGRMQLVQAWRRTSGDSGALDQRARHRRQLVAALACAARARV